MRPIKKISDLPRITVLDDEHQVLIRNFNGKRVWVGGHVGDVVKYRKNVMPINDAILVKRSNDRLRKHLDSQYSHWLEDRDDSVQRSYGFFIETTRGALELRMESELDPFHFDVSKEFLDFTGMFEKHTREDLAYHKLYDENDSTWKWYKLRMIEEGDDVLFEFEIVDSTENPEMFKGYEEQKSDYNFYNHLLDRHLNTLFPHKLMDSDERFSLAIESEELVIELEEE